MKALANNWRQAKLGEFFRIKHGYAFRGEHFSTAGRYILLTPGNFRDEGGFKLKGDKEKHYTGEVPPAYILKKDDLIVAMTEQAEGLLGSSALIPQNDIFLHNQRLGLVVELDNHCLAKKFLYYLFNTPGVRAQIRATANGAKVRHTSPARIYEAEFALPPLSIQHRIAAILSVYDDLIENNTRRIAILEEMARRLYEEWFVHFRFPGHETAKMVESETGPVPEGWKVEPLSNVAEVNAESIRKGSAPKEIRYIDIKSVSVGRVEQFRIMPFSEAPSRARRLVRPGDILWSSVRPNLRAFALMVAPPPDTIASTGFSVISPRQAPFSFLYPALTTNDFVEYLINHATGAAYPAVNHKDFEAARLVVPPSEILETYDRIAEPMFVLAHRLDLKNTNLRAQRDLLLPKLISGEIEVSEVGEPELEVAAE